MKTTDLVAVLQEIVNEYPDSTISIYFENIIDDDDFVISEIEGSISLIPVMMD